MQFKKIYAKNFLSIGELELTLENKGLVLIDGINDSSASALKNNGAGKSSLISVLFYALYGSLPNGDGADKVINVTTGKDTLVKLWFEKGGQEYLIERGRKKNLLKFSQGDIDLTESSMAKTDTAIQATIGITREVFLSTIYFDGANSTPFSSLKDKDKKQLLESVVDTAVYARAQELAKLDYKKLEEDIANNTHKIDINQTKSGLIKSRVKDEKAKAKDYKDRLDIAQANLSTFLASDTNMTDSYDQGIKEAQDGLKLLSYEPIDSSSADSLYKTVTLKATEKDKAEAEQAQELAFLKQVKEELNSYQTSDICPTCGNLLDVEHKQSEINRLSVTIKAHIETYTALSTAIPKLNEEGKELVELYKIQKAKVDSQQSRFMEYTAQSDTYKATIAQFEQARAQYVTQEQQLTQQVEMLTNVQSDVYDGKAELAELKKELTQLNKQITKDIADKEVLAKSVKALSDTGIKSHVLDLVTPYLNERVNFYLAKLTGSSIMVEFSTQKQLSDGSLSDKFDIKVDNIKGGNTYGSLSRGEKRRVDIAISLSLQDLIMTKADLEVNVLFYDELFESLDSVGSENVIELLQNKVKDIGTIFVVTHNESLKPLFDTTITMVKENGISRLEEG